MYKNVVYVSVDSLNFWWGIYGFTGKMSWEDITIYDKTKKGFSEIARTCICTKNYFKYAKEELADDPDEKDFVEKISSFLNRNTLDYHYYYDNPDDEDFCEVTFEAERNRMGIKPRSIEIWHPNNDIDMKVIDESVRAYLQKFLDMDVDRVEFKNIVSLKKAYKSYFEEMKRWNKINEIVFSDELIQSLEKEWKISREKVIDKLNKSIKI